MIHTKFSTIVFLKIGKVSSFLKKMDVFFKLKCLTFELQHILFKIFKKDTLFGNALNYQVSDSAAHF